MYRKFRLALEILRATPHCLKHFQTYPPVFIIGAPRSGTTLTLKLFSEQPQITPVMEPFKLWKKAFRTSQDDSYKSRANFLGFQALRYFYYDLIETDKPYLVVKDPRDSIRIQQLKYLFPLAKFIHVIRDGRDVIASILKTSQNEIYLTEEDGWPHVRIPNYQAMFTNPVHINAAIQWQYCVSTSLRDLASISPDNLFTFLYEDLVANPATVAPQILKFACPEVDSNALEKIITTVANEVVKIP
jgi:hypothetical protein